MCRRPSRCARRNNYVCLLDMSSRCPGTDRSRYPGADRHQSPLLLALLWVLQVDSGANVTDVEIEAAQRLKPINVEEIAAKAKLTELDIMALNSNDSTYVQVGYRLVSLLAICPVSRQIRLDCATVWASPVGRCIRDVPLAALLYSIKLQAPPGVSYYRKPFEFLSLGIMAYVGELLGHCHTW